MSQHIADQIAIFNLASAYSAAASRLDARGMESVLTPDASLGGVAKLVGRDDVDVCGAHMIGDLFDAAFAKFEFIHQTSHVVDLRFEGDHARAMTMIVEYMRAKGGDLMLMLADYDDTLVRTSAGWRFSRRVLRVKSFVSLVK